MSQSHLFSSRRCWSTVLSGFALIASLLFFSGAARADDDAGAPDAASADAPLTPTTTPTPTPAPPPTPTPAPTPAAARPPTATAATASPATTTAVASDASSPPPTPNYAPLAPETTPLTPFPAADGSGTASGLKLTPTGYVEAYYAWNFNRPANGITNYRGFDNRHNSFTLSNVAFGTFFEAGAVSGKIMLQFGSTPSTYYGINEPTNPGASGANGSSAELWKYLQEAYVTYKAPIGRGLSINAGLMASPIGMEQFAVKDHWAWSRSNLYFGLPYYHTGLRASYPLTDRLTAVVSVLNGWNSVVDNNEAKSVETHLTYRVPDKGVLQVLYFGGVERANNAPEGQYWRHHFDAVGEIEATSWLQLAAQADYGFEPNRIGTASWFAGAAAARIKARKWLYIAVRGDRFYEHRASDGALLSTPIFWNGVEWVSSATATLDLRPHDHISFRLEFRHDQADGLLYFTGDTIEGDGSARAPYVTNARRQQTLLLGATAWF